jgi:thiosulfate/3-mercaptopyruvate sulfurtransferase
MRGKDNAPILTLVLNISPYFVFSYLSFQSFISEEIAAMKRVGTTFAFVVVVMAYCFGQTEQPSKTGQVARPAMLVSTSWLQDHLKDPGLIIFHVSVNRREYREGHIPGARFLWTQALAYSDPDLTLELPSLTQADSVLRNLGVSDGVKIVLYFDNGNVSPTTRVFLTLDYLGLGDRVSLLDGGLDAWKAEGRPITAELPTFDVGSFTPKKTHNVVVSCDWVRDNLKNPKVTIVDARGAQFYTGNGGGMPRAGHIPGAINIAFSSLVDSTNKLKDPATLRDVFLQAGIEPGNKVVSYCHIGQQATVVYFVARYLGYDAQLYDGSFEEWSGRKELPVENPAAAPKK